MAGSTLLIDMLTTRAAGSGKDSLALRYAAGLKGLTPFSGLGELIGVEGIVKCLLPYGPRPWLRTESRCAPSYRPGELTTEQALKHSQLRGVSFPRRSAECPMVELIQTNDG
jgi:hypothetical protein